MYKHILIPIDGSSLANTGLEQGLGLARALGASVTVVTAYGSFQMPSMETVQLEGVRQTYEHQAKELAGSYLTEDLVFMLESMGYRTGVDLARLLAARALLADALPQETLRSGVAAAGIPKTFLGAAAVA